MLKHVLSIEIRSSNLYQLFRPVKVHQRHNLIRNFNIFIEASLVYS